MRKSWIVPLIVIAVLLLLAVPSSAVRFGEPDGETHPYVGLLVFDVGGRPGGAVGPCFRRQ